jgi:flagellar motility protein MotE (MotC chaperone)
MGTLVAIFRKKIREDEKPGNSLFCIQQKEDLNKLETFTKENYKQIEKNKEEDIKKFEELKQLVNDTNKEVVIL